MRKLQVKAVLLVILSVTMTSCLTKEEKDQKLEELTAEVKGVTFYNDDFDGDALKDFWRTNQFTDPSRWGLVEDPLDPDNKVLRIDLKLDDYIAGGWRSEMKVMPKDSFGYKNNLSFKFFLPDSFYADEVSNGYVVIQQWHDDPYPGFTWKTNKNKAGPPFGLYLEHKKGGDWNLVLKTGLKTGNINEVRLGRIDTVATGQWHEFNLETYWSLYEDGYFKGTLNGNCFSYDDNQEGEVCTILGRNMYHIRPNYFKMGLYRTKSMVNDRHIYFDDFKMSTGRIGYFAEPTQ